MTGIRLQIVSLAAAVYCLSGCSELSVIGKATMRELTSDAINVERAAYKSPAAIEEQKTTVAQAMLPPAPVKRKADQKKGLWEHQ